MTKRSSWGQVARLGAAAAALSLAASGCIIDFEDEPYDPYYDSYGYCPTIGGLQYETIDADQVMTTDLGWGVGLFIEYEVGGIWRLWTACDTYRTDMPCEMHAYVVADTPISDVQSDNLEAADYVDLTGSYSLALHTETWTHWDGVQFQATPGAAIEVELVFEGCVEPQYIFWVGNGHIDEYGAAGSPVVFEPNHP